MKILITGGSGFIGTNLTQSLHQNGVEFLNIDKCPPKESALAPQWVNCDILDFDVLLKAFASFQPTHVIHLAAETDTDPTKTIEDYKVNIDGTLNVLNAIKSVNSVERFILTSTQFVNQSQAGPKNDLDYDPHTVYGESKIITENQLRSNELPCVWTIIRPTNIWGPWHLRYPFEFWKILAEGKYVHPGKQKVVRSYGYVGNVVHQMMKILELPTDFVNKKVYYVGDAPIGLYEWVNGFSLKQTGKKVRVVPRSLVYSLALFGDLFKIFGVKFPITTSRYKSMTTDNPANMGKTFSELGPPKYTLEEGIDETVKWISKHHPELIKVR